MKCKAAEGEVHTPRQVTSAEREVGVSGVVNAISQKHEAEIGTCYGQDGGGEEEQNEPVGVVVADAAVDKDAVVVKLADAVAADGAVL